MLSALGLESNHDTEWHNVFKECELFLGGGTKELVIQIFLYPSEVTGLLTYAHSARESLKFRTLHWNAF